MQDKVLKQQDREQEKKEEVVALLIQLRLQEVFNNLQTI